MQPSLSFSGNGRRLNRRSEQLQLIYGPSACPIQEVL